MKKQKIFLETSIQIDRLLHTRERREEIRRNIASQEVCTSSYVLMEFQRTVLQDICYIRSVVETECHEGDRAHLFLADLDRALATHKGNFSARSARRSRLITAAVMDQFSHDDHLPKSELLEFLDHLAEQLRIEFFEIKRDDPYQSPRRVECLNATACDLVAGDFRCEGWRFVCKRENARCRLPQLLEEHAGEIAAVRKAFEGTAKSGDRKMVQASGRILEASDWHVARGQRNCWPLGDTIIALEAPADAAIYTTDRHFETICRILGKSVYREESLG